MAAHETAIAKRVAAFQHTVPSHTYTVGHVMLFVTLVLEAATSLRGASRVMVLIMAVFHLPLATPSWFTGRLWLLRLGYPKIWQRTTPVKVWVNAILTGSLRA